MDKLVRGALVGFAEGILSPIGFGCTILLQIRALALVLGLGFEGAPFAGFSVGGVPGVPLVGNIWASWSNARH